MDRRLTDRDIAQASVIGAMLLDESLIGPTLSALQPADFLNEDLRRIFLAMRKDFAIGQPVDLVTVLERLRGDGPSETWAELLKVCMNEVPSTANHSFYITAVRDQAKLQRLNNLGLTLAGALTLEAAQEAVDKLNEQMVGRQGLRAVTMAQAAADFFERQQTKPKYLKWGFPALDRRLYAEAGSYILLGGRPSAGKTALGLAAAWAQGEEHRVGFFSLETGDKLLADRTMARVAEIPMSRVKRRNLTEDQMDKAAMTVPRFETQKLEFIPAAGSTVADIGAFARSRRYEIIYIDYVQLIAGDESRGLVAKNTAISQGLHTLAQSTGITVVGLAQLSRPSKAGAAKAPRMDALRESGQYEQDADIIMLLYREDETDLSDPNRRLDVAKNKEGELGGIDLAFDGATQTFSERQPTKGEHYQQVHRDIKRAARGEYVPAGDPDPEWVQTAMMAEELPQ